MYLEFENVEQARASLSQIETAAQVGLRVLAIGAARGEEEKAWRGARQVLLALPSLLDRIARAEG